MTAAPQLDPAIEILIRELFADILSNRGANILDMQTQDSHILMKLEQASTRVQDGLEFDARSDVPLVSVVIPVYRSEGYLARTVQAVLAHGETERFDIEIVLVNDSSPDDVWSVIELLAEAEPRVVAVSLSRNYGQHAANVVGFRYASGDCVITMDDDLQNPPEEIDRLVDRWNQGHDLVIGAFADKQHERVRSLGSKTMQLLNRKVFDTPDDLIMTNFRLIDRSILDKINAYRTPAPYTTGLAVMFSENPANVIVRHDERRDGVSNYNLVRLVRLAWSVVFNYSNLPIKVLVAVGGVGSFMAFAYSLFLIVKAVVSGSGVPGWTSLALMVSVGNAVILAILSIIGEYLLVLLRQLSAREHFHVNKVIRGEERNQ